MLNSKTFCTDFCNKAHKLQHTVWPFPHDCLHSFIHVDGQTVVQIWM